MDGCSGFELSRGELMEESMERKRLQSQQMV